MNSEFVQEINARDSQEEMQQENYQANFGDYQLEIPLALKSQPSQFSDPPVLSYSYSGVSNTSSNNEYYFSSFHHQEHLHKTLIFLKPEQLYDGSITKLINEVHQTILLNKDLTLFLLYQYRWSRQKLNDSYFDCFQIYQAKNNLLMSFQQKTNEKVGECEVCCSVKNLISSIFCDHSFCHSCWRNYIEQQLYINNIFCSCMYKCHISPILPHIFVHRYFPELLPLYKKQICINYSNTNKQISYCPSTNNQHCQIFSEQPISSVLSVSHMLNWIECVCGEQYCFHCRKEPHFPLSCDDVVKWSQIIYVEEGSLEWISKNTKNCPKCKVAVQKYIGCHYVKCLCGAEFCYECCKNWDQFHKDQKGECMLSLKKKSSLEERTETQVFLELQQKLFAIKRTQNKNIDTLNNLISQLESNRPEQWILSYLHQIKKSVNEAWWIYKWSLAGLFLYKKEAVSPIIEEDYIQSILEIIKTIEGRQRNMNQKQMMLLKNGLGLKIEKLESNKNIWLEAWRNC